MKCHLEQTRLTPADRRAIAILVADAPPLTPIVTDRLRRIIQPVIAAQAHFPASSGERKLPGPTVSDPELRRSAGYVSRGQDRAPLVARTGGWTNSEALPARDVQGDGRTPHGPRTGFDAKPRRA
jgi:hypothetical protein